MLNEAPGPRKFVTLTGNEARALREYVAGDIFDVADLEAAVYAIDRVLDGHDADSDDD